MSEPGKKGGTLKLVVGLLVLVVVGGLVSGYMYPGLPWGPLVGKLLRKGADGMNKSGVYKVTVKNVTLSPEEFNQGETVDIQITLDHVDADGKTKEAWTSTSYGDRIAIVGKDSLTAQWEDRPFEMQWRTGEKLVVKVWDKKGGAKLICTWDIEGSEVFPLSGSHTFDKVKGKTPRPGGTNQIVFASERKGDLPAEK